MRKLPFCCSEAESMAAHSWARYLRSQSSSSVLLPIPAVRAMMLIPRGISRSLIASLSCARSSPSIRLETPPPRGFLGINTRYLPARLIKVVSAAPLDPLSSFSTWTTTSCPTFRTSCMRTFVGLASGLLK